ncbi:MAG: GGDEF domain-containing protein [Roseovarius sp.]
MDATAYRLIDTLENPISHGAEQLRISASIGSGICPPGRAADIEGVMREADTALYAAKEGGRKAHRLYTPSLGQIGAPPVAFTHPGGRG